MRFTKEQGEEFEQKLIERGYRRYVQHYRSEDYMYWKGFEKTEDREEGYSVGFAFYDWSKYPQYTDPDTIAISLHFLLGNDQGLDRLDIDITDNNITLEGFEQFCSEFYKFFKTTKFYKK